MTKKFFNKKKEANTEAKKRDRKVFRYGKKFFVGTEFEWLNL
jgi:hypothetical protein